MTTAVASSTASMAGPSAAVASFRDGMALLAGAVTVVTTDGVQGRAGLTATAVCSVTDTPPTLLVCVNRGAYSHAVLAGNGVLCVNVLGHAQQEISRLFSSRDVTMAGRFERVATSVLASGSPAIDGAVVNFDGRIVAVHDIGSHSIFVTEVDEVRTPVSLSQAGLVYFKRQYHAVC